MNDWVVPRLTWDDKYRPHRGRVLTKEDLDNGPKFYRYHNEDENFVTPRTLPGVSTKGAFFIRGSGHNKYGGYTETPDDYQEVMDRLRRKHSAAAKFIPEPEIIRRDGARFGVVCMGGTEPAVKEALDLMERQGTPADFMRLKGFPFGQAVEDFLTLHEMYFIVEQSRDAQLRSLLLLETGLLKQRVKSVLVYGGFPLSAHHVVKGILRQL